MKERKWKILEGKGKVQRSERKKKKEMKLSALMVNVGQRSITKEQKNKHLMYK